MPQSTDCGITCFWSVRTRSLTGGTGASRRPPVSCGPTHGWIDEAAADSVKDELTGATAFDFADGLARHGYAEYDGIVFRLDDSSRLDVNGMAVIMRIYSHLQSLGKELYVVGASVEISRGLSRLGLAKVLNAPEVARREAVDTDPSLSTLTGPHRVVR